MTVKRLIGLSVIWTVLMTGAGMFGVWYIIEHPARGLRSEERSAQLGGGLGVVTSFGYAALWLPFAFKLGQKRCEERNRQLAKKKKPHKRRPRSPRP